MRLLRHLWTLAFILTASQLMAGHVLGGHITWECLGGNQYRVTFTMYKDCYGSTVELPVENVNFKPSGCGLIPFSQDLTLQSATEVSDLCATELANSSCSGGLIQGTQKLVYSGVVTLDPTCNWEVFWYSGDWSFFNNINPATFPDSYISAHINPAAGCLNSVTITSPGVPYECANVGSITNNITVTGGGAYSLSYSLVPPQTITDPLNPFNSNAQVPGYTDLNGLSINSSTGAVTFNSAGVSPFGFNGSGVNIATIQILMMQGADTVGIVFENMAFVIRDCATTTTDFISPEIQGLNPEVTQTGPLSLEVCAGDSVCFTVSASNSNTNRTVLISASFASGLNAGNPVFTDSGELNPASGEVCLATNPAMVGGPFNIHLEATDDACILPGFDQFDVSLTIRPNLAVSITDALICSGQPLIVQATGGNSFTWTVLSGDNTPGFDGTGGTQTLESISSDTEIEVTLNGGSPQCIIKDTISVGVSLSSVTLTPSPESCLQNDGAVSATIVGGSGNYTYSWDSGQIIEDITGLDGGNYCLTVSDPSVPGGCSKTQCATVTSTPPPSGTIAVQGGVTTLCEGASATLVFTGTGDNTQAYTLTVTGAGANVPASINNGGTFTVTPPVGTTTYTLTQVSYLNSPACVTPTNSQVTLIVRPLVDGSFDPSGPICVGANLPLTVQLSETGNYNVTYTASPADPGSAPNPSPNPWADGQVQTFNPAVTTTYTITDVQYTTAPFCPNPQNNPISVTVNPLPTATLTGGTSVCAGVCTNLVITLTGTAPWTVVYSVGGANQPPIVINSSPYNLNVCPASTSQYCLVSVSDANNCNANVGVQCQTVTVNPVPALTFSGNANTCAGSCTNLTFNFTSAPGTYDITLGVTDTDPLTPATLTIDNFAGGPGSTYQVCPNTDTQYALQSVSFDGNSVCSTTPGTQVTIDTFSPITTSNLDADNCNNIGTAYTATFTISGGQLPYNVVPAGASLVGGNFTSNPILSGAGANFTITDAAGVCPSVSVNVPAFNCPVLSNSGTMSNVPQFICGDNPVTGVWNNNGFLDGNDQQIYVLHTSATSTLGTILASDCDDASFNDVDSPLTPGGGVGQPAWGVTYYISSVVGDDDGSGNCVNIGAPNVQVSPGQPVTWVLAPTAAMSGGGSACTGQSVNVSVDFTGVAPWTFTYSINGGAPISVTTSSDPYTIQATSTGNYQPVTVSSNGCSGLVSGSAAVTIHPLPTAAVAGSTSICDGDCTGLTLTLTGTGPWTVNYTENGGAPASFQVNNSPYNWVLCPSVTTNYCITSVTDANNCTNSTSVCHSITVNPLPTGDLGGDGVICQGGAYNFNVALTGQTNWDYVITTPGGDVTISNATLPETYSASVAGDYFITQITDGNGCVNDFDSPMATLTVEPLPTATILSPGSICQGETHSFNVTFTGAVPYTYSVDGPGNNDQPNLVALTANGTFNATVAGNYSISVVTDGNNCQSSAASASQPLTVNPIPSATLSASASVCSGLDHSFTVNLTGTGPFDVEIYKDNAPFTSLVGVAGPSTTFLTGDAGSYTIQSVIDNGVNCSNTTPSAASVLTVLSLPTGDLGGDGVICQGGAYNFNVALTGQSTWDYVITTPSGDVTVSNVTSPNTYSATVAGDYFITQVTDGNGCVNDVDSPIATLTVEPLPTATILSAGSICQGETHAFNVTFTGAAPFTFNVDGPGNNDQSNLVALSANGTFNATVAGSYNISLITDNNGCQSSSASASQTLTVNPLPSATLSPSASVCSGLNHTFTVNLIGTGPFDIEIYKDGALFNALAGVAGPSTTFTTGQAGNYTIESVIDNGVNCSSASPSAASTLTVLNLPTGTLGGNGVICQGGSHNFNVTLTGQSDWDYVITTPGGDVTVSNATSPTTYAATVAGNYFITRVTDSNGCINNTDSPVVTLTVEPLPTATINGPGTICSGGTHSFGVAFTGEAPFSFNVDGPGNNDQSLNSLGLNSSFNATVAGSYVITTVTDNNGCQSAAASAPQILTVNSIPTGNLSPSASVCSGLTHTFTVNLTGTGPFNVTIYRNGAPFTTLNGVAGPSATFAAGLAGNYTINSITDTGVNCTNNLASLPSTLTVLNLPTGSWTSGNSAFCSGSTVPVSFGLTGPPNWSVRYTIDAAVQPQITGISSSPHTIQAGQAGTYCLSEVIDANGCVSQPNSCITITSVNIPTAAAGADLIVCSDEAIQIGTAGQPGVIYTWGASPELSDVNVAQPNATVTNTTNAAFVRTYTVTASLTQSGITCTSSDAMNLTVQPAPSVTALASDNTICFGETTTITASGAGPGGTYEWIADPAFITGPLDQPVTTVAPVGSVTFTVRGTDVFGCFTDTDVEVEASDDIVVAENFTADVCFNVCDGTIDLLPSGGYGQYEVVWSVVVPDPDGFNQTDLCAGTYGYTVTDSEGCNTAADNLSIAINELPENLIDDVILTQPTCAYSSNGVIQIVEPGAQEYELFNCPENDNVTQLTDSFSNLQPAICYAVTVTDADGCRIEQTDIVLDPLSPAVFVDADDLNQIFCYQQLVPFTALSIGGTGNLNVHWYSCPDTTGCLEGTGSPFDFSLTLDTTLYAVAVDENGCRSDADGTFADLSDPVSVILQEELDILEICDNECQELTAVASGGNGPLTVNWFEVPATPNDPTIGPPGPTQTICPTLTTAYYVEASDGCNPPAYDTLQVSVFETPNALLSTNINSGCHPVTVQFSNLTSSPFVEQCFWEFDNGVQVPYCGNITYEYPGAGIYYPTLTVISVDGCIDIDTVDNPVIVYGLPEVDFTWEPLEVNVLEREVDFINLTEGGSLFNWTISSLGSSTEINPTFIFPDEDLSVYEVCLESETINGCRDTLCRNLVVGSILQVWVPNTFTPDKDGVNEVFQPVLKGYKEDTYNIVIYDRWGNKVFESDDPNEPWTGNVDGGSHYAPIDAYVWRIEVERLSDTKYEVFQGVVNLIR